MSITQQAGLYSSDVSVQTEAQKYLEQERRRRMKNVRVGGQSSKS